MDSLFTKTNVKAFKRNLLNNKEAQAIVGPWLFLYQPQKSRESLNIEVYLKAKKTFECKITLAQVHYFKPEAVVRWLYDYAQREYIRREDEANQKFLKEQYAKIAHKYCA